MFSQILMLFEVKELANLITIVMLQKMPNRLYGNVFSLNCCISFLINDCFDSPRPMTPFELTSLSDPLLVGIFSALCLLLSSVSSSFKTFYTTFIFLLRSDQANATNESIHCWITVHTLTCCYLQLCQLSIMQLVINLSFHLQTGSKAMYPSMF